MYDWRNVEHLKYQGWMKHEGDKNLAGSVFMKKRTLMTCILDLKLEKCSIAPSGEFHNAVLEENEKDQIDGHSTN